MCGENRRAKDGSDGPQGSSPRVRGKRAHARVDVLQGRLIPACAGKTGTSKCQHEIMWAHPRVCGENRFDTDPLLAADGSSPRVRGKRDRRRRDPHRRRLIPACAGKTSPCARLSSIVTAHPRVCGENVPGSAASVYKSGSSPRVRGKHPAITKDDEIIGLIPACAGKTAARGHFPGGGQAHPRVCGENLGDLIDRAATVGSSPRVRGKPIRFGGW